MKVELLISGQRNSDPKGPECAYSKTDWSDPIVCYNPLFDWSYKDVWEYIDFHHLPVCSLYQKGYTSLIIFVHLNKY